jgi:hypothetical protein
MICILRNCTNSADDVEEVILKFDHFHLKMLPVKEIHTFIDNINDLKSCF